MSVRARSLSLRSRPPTGARSTTTSLACGSRLWFPLLACALACAPVASAPPPSPPTPVSARSAEALRVELPRDERQRFRIEDDPDRALVASVYSLPSSLVGAGEARAMLAAVRAADARRQLLVLVDPPMAQQLADLVSASLRLLETRGGPYSPWPRDPFSFARASSGAVRVIVRPNLQRGREADLRLGPELVERLPPDLDRAWGSVRWARSDVPFHNGQVLLTRDAAWASLHTFEPRVLELLGVPRVPVESFATAKGVDDYVSTTRRAAHELAALYGRPVRFVHPLPAGSDKSSSNARSASMQRIFGGAGYDLDSLVTLLPHAGVAPPRGRRGTALVADLAAGERLLARLVPSDLTTFAAAYRLDGAAVGAGVAAAHASQRGRALASYLDLVAEHLTVEGWTVARLPLLVIPAAVLRDPGSTPDEYFFVGWNNVVVERRADGFRAEGFASHLAAGDRIARHAFDAAGVRLELLPPLLGSITRNGGYRCASNHLRAGG